MIMLDCIFSPPLLVCLCHVILPFSLYEIYQKKTHILNPLKLPCQASEAWNDHAKWAHLNKRSAPTNTPFFATQGKMGHKDAYSWCFFAPNHFFEIICAKSNWIIKSPKIGVIMKLMNKRLKSNHLLGHFRQGLGTENPPSIWGWNLFNTEHWWFISIPHHM